jgi:hypothetical protein
MITFPALSAIPTIGGDNTPPEVTPDGTGSICQMDEECPGNGVDTCLSGGGGAGFCTREGCGAGECQGSYLCCRECSDVVADMLPFEGSACLPGDAASQLSAAPASCTCD